MTAPITDDQIEAIKAPEYTQEEKHALLALSYRVMSEDSGFTCDHARRILNIMVGFEARSRQAAARIEAAEALVAYMRKDQEDRLKYEQTVVRPDLANSGER